MKHLHPICWLAVIVSLIVAELSAANPLITVLVGMAFFLLSRLRGGSRQIVFNKLALAGLVVLMIRAFVGLLPNREVPSPELAVFLPEITLPGGMVLGGPLTYQQIFGSITEGISSALLLLGLGLAWQVSAAGQWCDIARTLFGRGARLLVPFLSLGESIAKVHHSGIKRGRWVAIVRTDREISESWQRFTAFSRPNAKSSLVSALTLAGVGAVIFVIAAFGGVQILVGENQITFTAPMLSLGLLVAWLFMRIGISREPFHPPLRITDLLGLLATIPVWLAIFAADWTGDSASFTTAPATWPALPAFLCAALVIATVVFVVLDGTVQRRAA